MSCEIKRDKNPKLAWKGKSERAFDAFPLFRRGNPLPNETGRQTGNT
jgi:hypothetical protein